MTLIDHRLQTATETATTPGRISRAWALVLGGAWAVLFPLAIALEPLPADGAGNPWWGELVGFALLGTIIASVVGFVRLQRWSVGTSFIASTLFATGVFLCPATGHHAFGLWWFGEFAAAAALVTLSTVAYFRTR